MTKSNRTSQAKEGKGITTLALVRRENPMMEHETEQEYEDRTAYAAFFRLEAKENKTESEERELKELDNKCGLIQISEGGFAAIGLADNDLRPVLKRIRKGLVDELGVLNPQKRLLLDCLMDAVADKHHYMRMFGFGRYRRNDNGEIIACSETPDRIRYLKEARKGKENSEHRILRLLQVLYGISSVPLEVKATNAFFAHNQQVNQNVAPKDLDKNSDPQNNEQAGT